MAVVSACLASALSVTVGVAVGVLPKSWRPYLWLAWPISAALAVAYALVMACKDGHGSDGPGLLYARRQLLKRVEENWVTNVLQSSLYHQARLELGLVTKIEEPHPWRLESAVPRGKPELVAPGTPLGSVFEHLDQAMLILGAPGSGKTTTMLELLCSLLEQTRAELAQAHHDRDCTLPIPVVLPLASWTLRREPLEEWMLREIVGRYRMEREDVRAWIADRQIMPLLDGLDEVDAQYREHCVGAINSFRRQHGTVPVVVCCRTLDYQQLSTALALYGTLTVQPLSRHQVEQFLDRPDGLFADAQAALAREPGLWELAATPLMLDIMVLAFRAPASSGNLSGGTREDLRDRLFAAYVRKMLAHRPAPHQERQSTIRGLAYLACQLQRREQTVFSSDLLDPLSLPDRLSSNLLEKANWLLWKGTTILGMGAVLMISYGWRGATAGSVAGLLADLTPRCVSTPLPLR